MLSQFCECTHAVSKKGSLYSSSLQNAFCSQDITAKFYQCSAMQLLTMENTMLVCLKILERRSCDVDPYFVNDLGHHCLFQGLVAADLIHNLLALGHPQAKTCNIGSGEMNLKATRQRYQWRLVRVSNRLVRRLLMRRCMRTILQREFLQLN